MTARSKAQPEQAPLPFQIAEGVHLGLPECLYFDARALGSSDLVKLYWEPASWWYSSWLNDHRRVKVARKSAKDLGSATHALLLQGEAAYLRDFVIEPDAGDRRWAKTLSEVKALLASKGISTRGQFDPPTVHRLARKAGLAGQVWDLAWSSYEGAKRHGTRWLDADEDRRVRDIVQRVLDHDDLGPIFTRNGLSEVSVFWRRPDDPDTLLRARFDRLTPRRTVDPKTVSSWGKGEIDAAVRRAIEDHDYGVQRRFYDEARTQARQFIRDRKVHAWAPAEDGQGHAGASVLADEWTILDAIAASDEYLWVWLFLQLRCDDVGAERAPIIVPRYHQPAGAIWEDAGLKIEKALTAFRAMRETFTLTKPWAVVEPVRELVDEDVRIRTRKEYT